MLLESLAEGGAVLELQELRDIIDLQVRIGQELLGLRQAQVRGVLRDGLLRQLLEEMGGVGVADVERRAQVLGRDMLPGQKLIVDIFRHQIYGGICLHHCGCGARGRVEQREEADRIAYDVRLDRQIRIAAGEALEGFLEQHIGQLRLLLRRRERVYTAALAVQLFIQSIEIT